jgi:hypothetical protein
MACLIEGSEEKRYGRTTKSSAGGLMHQRVADLKGEARTAERVDEIGAEVLEEAHSLLSSSN